MLYPIETYYRILDQEERKGRLKSRKGDNANSVSYGNEVCELSKQLKEKRHDLREVKKAAKVKKVKANESEGYRRTIKRESVIFLRKVEDLELDISQLKDEMQEAKHREIDNIVRSIDGGKVTPKIITSQAREKVVYTYGDLQTLLVCKIVMLELKKNYHVYPDNRNNIIDSLTTHLQSKIKYGIIRADIHHFFESIPQERLVNKLKEDGKISSTTLRYIKRILYEYNVIAGNDGAKGLPRGICFSSYLAEIYLMAFDKFVRNTLGVLFYRRFVDDIMVLTLSNINTEKIHGNIETWLKEIGLEIHHEEKSLIKNIDEGESVNFDYLGYSFHVNWGHTTVTLSQRKVERYNILLDQIFRIYDLTKNSYSKKKSPLKEFISRIAVLTGNGNLDGQKNFVKTGIYYSNKMLTSLSDLEKLDETLQSYLRDRDRFSVPEKLLSKGIDKDDQINDIAGYLCNKYGFVSGFKTRRMYKHGDFTKIQTDLKHIYLRYSE